MSPSHLRGRDERTASQIINVESLESRTLFDLVPSIAGVLPPSLIGTVKTKSQVSVELTNTGASPIKGAYTIQLLTSEDGQLGDATPITAVKNEHLTPLGAGKMRPMRLPLGAFPNVPTGNYFVLVEVGGVLTNVADNVGKSNTTIAETAPFIDFADTIVRVGKTTVKPVGKSLLKVTITNEGNVPANGLLTLDIGSSQSSTGSPIDSQVPVMKQLKNFGPDKKMSFTFIHTILVGTAPGVYYATATVDPLNTFNEPDTSNNFAVTPTALTILSPFPDIEGVSTGPFKTTKGPGKGSKGTLTLDITSESGQNGEVSGTGSNSLGAEFSVTGSISTKGHFILFTDDKAFDVNSVLTGKLAGKKAIGTFKQSIGNSGSFTLTPAI
jgi:hypothetical protein